MCIFNSLSFSDNKKASSKEKESEEKKRKHLDIPKIIEPKCGNEVNDELGILIHSHPGSICNINEIEEDERRQNMKAVRNEIIRILPIPYKKQKPGPRRNTPV